MRHLSILIVLIVVGCATLPTPHDDPHDPQPKFTYIETTVRVKGINSFHYDTGKVGGPFGFGGSGNLMLMEELVRDSESVVLEIAEDSPADTIARLASSYFSSHPSAENLRMTYWDPEERFEGYKAEVRMDKEVYSDNEPVMLTIRIADDEGDAPWWLFTPMNIRIRDEKGEEVNILLYPVTETDSTMRSKVWVSIPEKTIDLTSFVDPYHGVEHIYNFSPGKYTATFYFYSDDGSAVVGRKYYAAKRQRRWGRLHSNTVAFEFVRRETPAQIDIDALFQEASRLIEESRPHEAVKIYKKIVSGTKDLLSIKKAIENILLIRHVATYDVPYTGEGKNLRGEITALVEKSKTWGNRWPEPCALELALLHVPMTTRRALIDRFVKADESFWKDLPVDEGEQEFFHDFGPGPLFGFPQLRPIVEEALDDPKTCPRVFRSIYLGSADSDIFRRDTDRMLAFLRAYPSDVLEYYSRHKAPKEMVPFIAQYFNDETKTWGNGPVQAMMMDEAFEAFELAAGLTLGISRRTALYDRVHFRDAIKSLIERWWKLHAHEYGVTPGSSDEVILARLQAMKGAHEARFGKVRDIIREDEHTTIAFDRKGIIGIKSYGTKENIELADGIDVPKELKKGVQAVICVTRTGDMFNGEYAVTNPNAMWVIPSIEQ